MLKKIIDKIRTFNMFCGIGESEVYKNEIRIKNYPFKPSSVFPKKTIRAEEVDALFWDAYPPLIKLKDDCIFISREYSDELKQFAEVNDVRTFKPIWNWQWILEPYLDTEYTEETHKGLLKLLDEKGIPLEEVASLRSEVKDQMIKYNFDTMLWEWGSLGLLDVLAAMRVKYKAKKFEDFYKRAMEIQFRNIEYNG